MSDLPSPDRRRSALPLVLGAVAVIAAVVAVALLLSGGDDDKAKTRTPQTRPGADAGGAALVGPKDAPFALKYPATWTEIDVSGLTDADPPPIAAIRRKDRKGLITVTVRGPVRGSLAEVRKRLPGELNKRFADFKLVDSREQRVQAGPAVYTSWVRTKSGNVQSNLFVPAGNISFSVDVLLPADARDAAAEAGIILRSFDVR
jgi:hypothetical protein